VPAKQTIDDPTGAALASQPEGSQALRTLDRQHEIAELESLAAHYEFALDSVPQPAFLYDKEGKLIFCNKRYAEFFRLSTDDVQPGATLHEITKRCIAAGTCPTDADEYLAACDLANSGASAKTWVTALQDGRAVRVTHQSTGAGGWGLPS